MPSLGDVYVDVHANTRDLKPEVRRAADDAGDEGGRQFSKSFDKQTKRSLGRFQDNLDSSVKRAIKNLPDIELRWDSKDVDREIVRVRNRLLELQKKTIGVDMDANAFYAEAAAIEGLLQALTRDREIDVRMNAQGALSALSGIAAAAGGAGAGGGAVARLSASFGALGASAAASAPLIIAVGAAIGILVGVAGAAAGALGGLALALGAPLGAAAGGGGLFALLAGKYVSETNKVLDQIKQLKEDSKFNEANALIAKLSTAQTVYMKAREGLSKAFKSFTKDNDSALLTPFTLGLEKLTEVLKGSGLEALINAVSGSLSKFLLNLDTKGINNLLLSMSKLAGPVIDSVLNSLSSFGSIMGSIFGAGKDLGVKALDGMSNALGRLDGYLKSKEGRAQLNEFFTWVETHGPGILRNFLDIAGGVKDFIKAMTPAGEAFLTFLGFFGKFGFLAPVFKAAMAVIMGAFTGLLAIIAGVTATLGGLFTLIGSIPGTPDWVDGIGTGLNDISTKAWDATKEMSNLLTETGKAKTEKVDIPVSAKTQSAKTAIRAVQALAIVPQTFPLDANKEPANSKINAWKRNWSSPFTITFDVVAKIGASARQFMGWVEKYGASQLRAWGIGVASGGRIPAGFARGGMVPGTTPRNRSFDNVAAVTRRGNPLRVQSGEWIINSAASRQNDRLLAAINSGFNAQRALGFSSGGIAPVKRSYASGGQVSPSINNDSTTNFTYAPVYAGPMTGSAELRDLDWMVRHIPVTGQKASVR